MWDLNMFLRQSIWNTNKILKEIGVLERKMRTFSKLARSARSHIHGFFPMLVFCWYTVVYSAIPQVIKGNCNDCIMYADVFWDLKLYMFLRRSLASLARAYKLHVHYFFVGTFGGLAPPPPPIPKSWLRYWYFSPLGKVRCMSESVRFCNNQSYNITKIVMILGSLLLINWPSVKIRILKLHFSEMKSKWGKQSFCQWWFVIA